MLLREKDRITLLKIFETVEMPLEIWAYGSRVNGTAHQGSDLDLVVRSQNLQKLPLKILLQLKEKIQESNIPILVELFDWARLPASFQRNIEPMHEVLFSNSAMTVSEPTVEYNKKTDSNKT